MENKSKKYLMFGLMGVVILALIIAMVTIYFRVNEKPVKPKGPCGLKENSFNTLLIEGYHKSLEEEKNYMISPYSLEFVLSMIRDGASGTTYEELSNLMKYQHSYNAAARYFNVVDSMLERLITML